jgi:hypothetical protein
MVNMNTMKTIVRLDAEHHTAELEIMAPHNGTTVEGLENTIRRMGFCTIGTLETDTPRFHITHTKIRSRDGSRLDHTRLAAVLSELRRPAPTHYLTCCCLAA